MRPLIIIKNLTIILNGSPETPEDTTEDQAQEPQGQPEDVFKRRHLVACKACDWFGRYDTELQAKKALGAHSRHCTGEKTLQSPFSKPYR